MSKLLRNLFVEAANFLAALPQITQAVCKGTFLLDEFFQKNHFMFTSKCNCSESRQTTNNCINNLMKKSQILHFKFRAPQGMISQ